MTGSKKEGVNKKNLTAEQYQVCHLKGTEAPFTGKYYNHTEAGTYKCVCCGAELFRSQDKYDSGSGWPSYIRPFHPAAVKEVIDNSHGLQRLEIQCRQCEAHLGHVFLDGPQPTGLRYCINSAALIFEHESSK